MGHVGWAFHRDSPEVGLLGIHVHVVCWDNVTKVTLDRELSCLVFLRGVPATRGPESPRSLALVVAGWSQAT